MKNNNKERYLNFCNKQNNITIFSQPWWLDAVCGEENWDVAIAEKGGEIWATMPFYIKKKWGFTLITMPPLTQKLGPFIKYPERQKYYKRLSWEKEIMNELIDQLPKFDYFYQHWDYNLTNWLPFYWRGFKQTTRYTYKINKEIDINILEKDFETDVRRRRRKALELDIKIINSENIEIFYKLNMMTFERKNKNIPYNFDLIKKIYENTKNNNSSKLSFALYGEKAISAAFLVNDSNSVYYLMGGIDPLYKDLGGMDLLLYDSIKSTLDQAKNFDFEGSIVESIEKYFRSFGSIQTPYFAVYKINSRILKIKECLKELLR